MTVIDLHHEIFGTATDAPPLLLVHGGAGSIATDWGAAIPTLSRTRQVIGVELQGHGHTPHSDRPYSFDNSAADLAARIERLGFAHVDIAGFSNGGPTVLRLARNRPELVRRAVIASGFVRRAGMIDGFWDGFDDADVTSVPAPLVAAYRAIDPDPANLRRMFELDLNLMTSFTDWDDAELTALTQPVLFIGGRDDVVRPEHTLDMARLVPNGWSLVVPAGHGDYLGMTDVGEDRSPTVETVLAAIDAFLSDR